MTLARQRMTASRARGKSGKVEGEIVEGDQVFLTRREERSRKGNAIVRVNMGKGQKGASRVLGNHGGDPERMLGLK